MALVKMLQQYSAPGVIKSPAATVLLVRLASKLATDDPGLRKPMLQLLDGFLRHKSEMVNFEAAKAICNFSDLTDGDVVNAIHVLQLFLTSPRAVTKVRYAISRLVYALKCVLNVERSSLPPFDYSTPSPRLSRMPSEAVTLI